MNAPELPNLSLLEAAESGNVEMLQVTPELPNLSLLEAAESGNVEMLQATRCLSLRFALAPHACDART